MEARNIFLGILTIIIFVSTGTFLLVDNSSNNETSKDNIRVDLMQSQGKIKYERENIVTEVELQLKIGDSYITVPDSLFIDLGKKDVKFGFNKTYTVAPFSKNTNVSSRYIISSNQPISLEGENIFSTPRMEKLKCGSVYCIATRREKVNFDDVCIITRDNGTIVFDPQCLFTKTNSKEVVLDFKTFYNASTKSIFIDPQITIVDVSVAVSTLLNITVENNFSHLTILDNNNLVLYMPFDTNTSVTTAYDYTNNDNDGTLMNDVVWNANGQIGGAYQFDGIDNSINLGNPASLQLVEGSIAMWIKADPDLDDRTLYSNDESGDNTGDGNFNIEESDDGTNPNALNFFTLTPSVSTLEGSVTVATGNWEHIMLTWNTSTKQIIVNGVLDNSVATAGEMSNTISNRYIGFWNGQFDPYLGEIDEVMIFNRSLSAAEVLAIYNNGTSRFFSRGEQIFDLINVSETAPETENRVNVSINLTEHFSSAINITVGDLIVDGYGYGDEFSFGSDGVARNIPILTPDNISLKFIFYAGNETTINDFYSPTLENDIIIDSWTEGAPADTCTYSSGDFIVTCSDNCVITSPIDLNNNDLIINGAGIFAIEASIVNIDKFVKATACTVIKTNGVIVG